MDSSQGYVIYRDTPSNESFDPSAPLHFFPAKDSDELFFALKTAFPHVTTHSERMRDAVIDFLVKERGFDQPQSKSQSPALLSTNSFNESTSTSPQSSWQSASSSSVNLSPQLVDDASPYACTPYSGPPISRVPSMTSPPAIDQMTSVFSLSTDVQPKTRSKRKMTDDEKAHYRRRRQVGVCDKCKQQKRKCTHIRAAQDGVHKNARPSNAVESTKKMAVKQAQQYTATAPPPLTNSLLWDPNRDTTFDLLENFVLDDSMDDLISFQATSSTNVDSAFWPDQHDWTLLDATIPPRPLSRPLPASADHLGSPSHGSGIYGNTMMQELVDTGFEDLIHLGNSHGQQAQGSLETLSTVSLVQPHLQVDANFDSSTFGLGTELAANSNTPVVTLQQQPLRRRIPKALHSIVDAEHFDILESSSRGLASPVMTGNPSTHNGVLARAGVGLNVLSQLAQGTSGLPVPLERGTISDGPLHTTRTPVGEQQKTSTHGLAGRVSVGLSSVLVAADKPQSGSRLSDRHDLEVEMSRSHQNEETRSGSIVRKTKPKPKPKHLQARPTQQAVDIPVQRALPAVQHAPGSDTSETAMSSTLSGLPWGAWTFSAAGCSGGIAGGHKSLAPLAIPHLLAFVFCHLLQTVSQMQTTFATTIAVLATDARQHARKSDDDVFCFVPCTLTIVGA